MIRRALFVALLTACGGSDEDAADAGLRADAGPLVDARSPDAPDAQDVPATCETWNSPSNCWPTAVASLHDCVPDEAGMLADDRTSCTFPDGTRIEFPSPLPTSNSNYHADITVRRPDESVCGVFFERDIVPKDEVVTVREVSAGGLTARFSDSPTPGNPSSTWALHCNDEEFVSETADWYSDCGIIPPTWSAALDADTATLTLFAEGTTGALFECTAQ